MSNLLRAVISAIPSVIITLFLFLGMWWLVLSGIRDKPSDDENISIDFSPVKIDEQTNTKTRAIPKKPPPPKEPPPPPKINVTQNQQVVNNMPAPNIPALSLGIGGNGPFLGAMGRVDPNQEGGIIPIVTIAPNYPRKAAIAKIEGWVKVEFTITETGTVINPSVVDSKPPRIFDREALRAILKYKFKAKIVDGVPQQQVATQQIDFKLAKE
jgi:protein TonB